MELPKRKVSHPNPGVIGDCKVVGCAANIACSSGSQVKVDHSNASLKYLEYSFKIWSILVKFVPVRRISLRKAEGRIAKDFSQISRRNLKRFLSQVQSLADFSHSSSRVFSKKFNFQGIFLSKISSEVAPRILLSLCHKISLGASSGILLELFSVIVFTKGFFFLQNFPRNFYRIYFWDLH